MLADPNQLENVILNLAVNARDAMPNGGRLTIVTANARLNQSHAAEYEEVAAGPYVMLAVSDTGRGMSPDLIGKVFDPFFTTKPLGQGTGLGLSVVDGFVRQSGGHVAIDSAPGQGTTVKVYLPRFVPPEPEAAPGARPEATRRGGKGERILVLEDDAQVRLASVAALRELGYDALEAGDAMEGVRLLADHGGIGLLFTDVGLPGGVDGWELAQAARHAQPGLRVLLTTGSGRDAVRHEGVSFIAKPFDLACLAAKVREVLDQPCLVPDDEAAVPAAPVRNPV